jgi:DNA repair protein RadC
MDQLILKSKPMKTYKKQISQYSLKKNKTDINSIKITCSRDAQKYARQFYFDDIDIFESFFVIMLNNANNTIGYVKISQGGITGTMVDVRIVAKYCIDSLAVACILVHNHPSGIMKPSQSDKDMTNKLKKGLDLLDVKILDHIILSPEENEYFSFGDENLM